MPLDSTIPQEVGVTARQIGGRPLSGQAPWSVLFPVDHLRIDGRVAVDKSGQYLTQMRLNPNKELIAVAFSPDAESSIAFDTLSKHLIAKGCVLSHTFSPHELTVVFLGDMDLSSRGVIDRKIITLVVSSTLYHCYPQTPCQTLWSFWTTCVCRQSGHRYT